jgi:hypothetical protein
MTQEAPTAQESTKKGNMTFLELLMVVSVSMSTIVGSLLWYTSKQEAMEEKGLLQMHSVLASLDMTERCHEAAEGEPAACRAVGDLRLRKTGASDWVVTEIDPANPGIVGRELAVITDGKMFMNGQIRFRQQRGFKVRVIESIVGKKLADIARG